MSNYTLSYVLTTFNKLEYLKVTLPFLIAARKDDEEIIVIDGGSTDGSADYLESLYKTKQIQQFVSEKDQGEAHGINKAFLLAKGDLIKIITDDDLYDFEVIALCKKFMLDNQKTDVLGFDGYSCKVAEKTKFEETNFIDGFYNWQNNGGAFLFCGLSLLIRKTSLPYLGLFNTAYKIIDMEYSLRISSIKSTIAFYTGKAFINIVNPGSNSVKFYSIIRKEYHQLRRAYPEAKLNFRINNPILMMKERLSRIALKVKPVAQIDNSILLEEYKNIVNSGHQLFEKNRNTNFKILNAFKNDIE